MHAQLCLTFVTSWTVAGQASLSMEFSMDWIGLPFPSLGDLPNPGIKLMSPISPALAGKEQPEKPLHSV